MVKSETRRDAEILVRNPSPRLFGEKFRDSKKVKTNHEKTRLRDLSKTFPRFWGPAKIFRDTRFSRYHSPPLIFNKYSPKAKLLCVRVCYCWLISSLGLTSTEPEVNNCFSICTRSDLNRIRKEIVKETISLIHKWIHAWTCSRKQYIDAQQLDLYCIFNLSFNFFVSFSINDWKENVASLNNSPFREETQSFICFCQLCTVNETVFRGTQRQFSENYLFGRRFDV